MVKTIVLSNKRVLLIIAILAIIFILYSFNSSAYWIRNITKRLPKHPTKKYKNRKIDQIESVIIHHSATDISATPDSIARYHVGVNSHLQEGGAPGIAYHYLIDYKGNVFQVNSLKTIAWHTSGQNTRSVGVCMIGDFDNQPPSIDQYKSLVKLLRFLKNSLNKRLKILGHREFANKSCPGDHVNIHSINKMVYG